MFNVFSLYGMICMESAPDPPPVPNPIATATAQGKADQQTAVANTALANANVYSPTGSSTYQQTGTQAITNPNGSVSYIPTYTNTVSLSPSEQQLFNQQQALGSQENTIAQGALNSVNSALQQPVAAPTPLQTSVGAISDPGAVQRTIAAQYALEQPMINQQHQALAAQLASQGIAPTGAPGQSGNPGGTAYSNAQGIQGVNDAQAMNEAVLSGNQEQNTLYGQALSNAQLANSASAQGLQQNIARQNQPINEVTALMSGGQVSMPQFAQYQGGTVAQTPVASSVYNSANLANQQYQYQANAAAQDNAALAGLGGSVLGAGLFKYSDPRLKDDQGVIGKVGDLPIHKFNYKGDPTPLMGFMADEVKREVPEAVKTDKSTGYKKVNYAAALAGALKKVG